ncbi:hypothetical protein ACWNT8_06725 [Pigmentibacter ruber]
MIYRHFIGAPVEIVPMYYNVDTGNFDKISEITSGSLPKFVPSLLQGAKYNISNESKRY